MSIDPPSPTGPPGSGSPALAEIAAEQSQGLAQIVGNRDLIAAWIDSIEENHANPGVDAPDFAVDVIVPDGVERADASLAVRGQLLVWDRDVGEAVDVLTAAGLGAVPSELATPRVRILELEPDSPGSKAAELVRAIGLLRAANLRASANHVLLYNYTAKTFVPPRLSPVPLPERGFDTGRGLGITVSIIDSGVDPDRRGDRYLDGVTGEPDPGTEGMDPAVPVTGATGHGSLVAGIVRRVAPGATVRVRRVMTADGLCSDVNVARAMLAEAKEGAQVINLSLGGPSLLDNTPLAMEDALAHLPRSILVVAAAGNDGSSTARCYPAAFKRVVAVGATEPDGTPARYSNRGDWVDVSAQGSGVVSTFVNGTTSLQEQFAGDSPVAVASGTSFAAPQVSGAFAALLADGIAPADALAALTATGRMEPDVGVIVRLLDQ